jgi:hypothetical protein
VFTCIPYQPLQSANGHFFPDKRYCSGYYLSNQPANRFWTFQWIETSIYLAIAMLAPGATFWLVRRRLV